jgi:hypothetical protein
LTTKEGTVTENTSKVLEPEVEISQDGKIREIAMDSVDSVMVCFCSGYVPLLARTA